MATDVAAALAYAKALVASLELYDGNPAQRLSLLDLSDRVHSAVGEACDTDPPVTDPQTESPFFQLLPQEIRNQIFSHLLSSTQLTPKAKPLDFYQLPGPSPANLPPLDFHQLPNLATHALTTHAPNPSSGVVSVPPSDLPTDPLAILRTCRRVHSEIGGTWVSHVTFTFKTLWAMLDTLTSLPPGVLARIRHVRTLANTLMLTTTRRQYRYPLVSALLFLPGLRLDTLTVSGELLDGMRLDTLSISKEMIDSRALHPLIMRGSGWRELRYFSQDPIVCLGLPWLVKREEQGIAIIERGFGLAQWQSALEARDGASSGPSVTACHSTISYGDDRDCPSCKAGSAMRRRLGLAPWEHENGWKVLAVVKRGDGADYEVKADAPHMQVDARRDFPGLTWREIRERHVRRVLSVYGEVIRE